MSITTRTNRATNPNVAVDATGWSAVAGTGGTATGARNTGAGYDGAAGFFRVSWTAATTAVTGGINYLQTGLEAATEYTHSVFVRPNKNQSVALSAQYQTAAAANVNLVTGSTVSAAANQWTRLSVTGTSGAAVDRVVLSAAAVAPGVNWANGDTFDGDLMVITTGAVLLNPFDGSTANANSTMYAWSGSANASTSTATVYQPALALLNILGDDPCDRVEVTVTDMVPTESTYTLWRTVDGERQAVRGFRSVVFNTSDFAVDYEAPLGRVITYELQALAGLAQGMPASTANTTLGTATQDYGWIQDPLNPDSAMKLYGDAAPGGQINLEHDSVKSLKYPAEVNLVPIMGASKPVALIGQRSSAQNITFDMATEAELYASELRALIMQAPLLLIRPVKAWASALPGLCYVTPPEPEEMPVNEAWGGQLIRWRFVTPLVAAPAMNVLVPKWTYGDVQALWTTYQQAATSLSGRSYLAVKKNPATGL